MNIINIIFSAEIKMLRRNGVALSVAAIFMLLGIYAIIYGHGTIKNQQQKIDRATAYIDSLQLVYSEHLTADTTTAKGKSEYEMAALPSLVRFNYNFLVANQPSALAQLSTGQRDLYPYYYMLNAQSLYTQTLKGEIYNPFKLSSGNFDLAFVFIYLMPLLIIILAFDIISSEKDMGTLKLLNTLPISLKNIIFTRLLFRFMFISGLVIVLSLIGFLFSGALNTVSTLSCLSWIIIILSYAAFWFGLSYFIASYNMQTALNAMLNLMAWVAFLIIIPSLISIVIRPQGASPASKIASLMRSRNMAETDEAMHKALDQFYAVYPQYQPTDTTRSPYFYFQGYSAFLAITDRAAKKKIDSLDTEVLQHDEKYNLFNPLNPAVNTQNMLNQLASTGLNAERNFKSQVYDFHQRIFWFSNKPLFANKKMNETDFLKAPVFHYRTSEINKGTLSIDLSMLLLSFSCLLLSAHRRTGLLNKSML